jgi:putative ABC transport system permease protein
MNAVGFAWRSLVRQPARAALGVIGVAAVGALLFDMLMLSNGLVLSMRDLLDRYGWDIRVAGGDLPLQGPRIRNASKTADAIAGLPSVRAALLLRIADARIDRPSGAPLTAQLVGIEARSAPGRAMRTSPPWTIVKGRDVNNAGDVVINAPLASASHVAPGSTLTVRALCVAEREALPPTTLRVTGLAEFPFSGVEEYVVGGTLGTLKTACSGNVEDEVDLLLVTSTGDADGAAAAIRAAGLGVNAMTNDEVVGRFQQAGFSYFRQISSVLTAVTVSFAVLLITVLLTVSVNQRLGEIAALRALGFSRTRVVKDVLSESVLIVGTGGLLSLPLGWLLAFGLDDILKAMPGVPAELHFFVLEREALAIHLALLVLTALLAAAYPMRIVSRLPIAATLRDEVIG